MTTWGFAIGDGGVILNLIPINTEDNVLHLLLAIAGLAAGAASSARAATHRGVRRGSRVRRIRQRTLMKPDRGRDDDVAYRAPRPAEAPSAGGGP